MLIRIALRNLIQAQRRTLLLGIAIALVAMLFLILRTVSHSISERMVEAATTLSAGHVNVGGFFKERKKDAAPIITERKRLRDFVKAHVPEAVEVIDRHRGWGRVISDQSSINVGMSGIVYEEEGRFFKSLRLAAEKEYVPDGSDQVFGRFEDMQKPNSVLIFAAQAKKLSVRVGDTLTFVTEGANGLTSTVDLRIVAIASDIGFMSNFSLYVPRQVVLDLYRLKEDTSGSIMVYLKSADMSTEVMERLRTDLTGAGFKVMDHDPQPFWMKFDRVFGEDWLGQQLDLTIWSDEISFVLWVVSALDFVAFFVIGVLAIIIIGGITNSMWMAVRERTKEIGTIRAIGAPRHYVLRLFVIESMLLGFAAACLGVLLGVILMGGLNILNIPITQDGVRLFLLANNLQFNIHIGQLIITVILFSVLTGLAALYPALKAARMRPVEALMGHS